MDVSSCRSLLRSLKRRAANISAAPGAATDTPLPRGWDEPTLADKTAVVEALLANRCRLGGAVTGEAVCVCIERLLATDRPPAWEVVALAVLVFKECIMCIQIYGQKDDGLGGVELLIEFAKELTVSVFINHEEPRVRKLCSELIGVMAKHIGPPYFDELGPVLYAQVSAFFERREVSRETRLGAESEIALDDTTGWYALETLLCSYRELVSGCGPRLGYLDRASEAELGLFIRDSALHINRYIRQATFEFIHALMLQLSPGALSWSDGAYVPLLCRCITAGLSDDFSQVRFPATFAARYFLVAINDQDREALVWPQLVPRLCLNRYYPADGVKTASLETWSAVSQGKGKALVTRHVAAAFEHYASMVDNKSHLICEAACWVMGELGSIIDAQAVMPYLAGIMDILGVCLGDDSWQVRGAACVATSRIVRAHPEQACDVACDVFLPLWVLHLNDFIWALRSDSATALGIAMRCPVQRLAAAATDAAVEYLTENLAEAAKVKKSFSFIPQNSTLYSFIKNKMEPEKEKTSVKVSPVPSVAVVARAAANAEAKQRFGVVELRRRPGSWGCCMDCSSSGVERKRWQGSEGGVLLLAELATARPEKAARFVGTAVSLLNVYENAEYGKLHNTIWQQLPRLLESVGKSSALHVAPELLQRFTSPPTAPAGGPGALLPPPPPDSGPAVVVRRNAMRVLAKLVGSEQLLQMYQKDSCSTGSRSDETNRLREIFSSPVEKLEEGCFES